MKKKKKEEEWGWNENEHDTTPYGKKLALAVANKVEKGIDLANSHRDYCGKGLAFYNEKFNYVTVNDGNYFFDEVIFDSKSEFVDWLAAQSDETMCGKESNDKWIQDNQRITRSRLENFVAM